MPIRSGTSPDAMPWAILLTISVCGMYVRTILQSGYASFQAATNASTIPALPPERSHISRSPSLAQPAAASLAAGSLAAGSLAAGAEAATLSAADGLAPPPLQAANTRIAIAPRATSLSWLLIPCSSHDLSRGVLHLGHASQYHQKSSAYIRFHKSLLVA